MEISVELMGACSLSKTGTSFIYMLLCFLYFLFTASINGNGEIVPAAVTVIKKMNCRSLGINIAGSKRNPVTKNIFALILIQLFVASDETKSSCVLVFNGSLGR